MQYICVAARSVREKRKKTGGGGSDRESDVFRSKESHRCACRHLCPPAICGSKGQREFRGQPVNIQQE